MPKNSVYYRSLIALFALLLVLTCPNAESQTTTLDEFNTAHNVVNTVKTEINGKLTTLGQYFAIRNDIVNMLADNNEDLRDNALNNTSLEGAISALGLNLLDKMDGVYLKNLLDGVNTSIEEFIRIEIDEGIFQRQGNQKTNTIMGFNQAFTALETAYDALDADDTLRANRALFGSETATSEKADLSQTSLYMTVPDANSVFVSPCANPDGSCYGYYPDANFHKQTCSHKHGDSGEANVVWWNCHSDTCHRAEVHWRLCPGTCGDKFAPNYWIDSNYSDSYPAFSYVDNFPHEVKCKESVYDGFLGVFATCYSKYETVYYTCEHSTCPNASYHHNGGSSYYSESPSQGTSPSENGGCDTDGNGNGNNGNGNGNGAPPPSGGSGNQGNGNNGDGNGNGAPNPNGGCTPPCINSHCISDTAHTIYTCIREIKDR